MKHRIIWAIPVALIAAAATVLVVSGSSHREAPAISEDSYADNTDLYAFVDPNDSSKITIIANWIPFQEPAGGPNFHRFSDDVLYQVHIDNDGDAVEDIVYGFRFETTISDLNTFLYNTGPINFLNDPNWNIRQTYTVTRKEGPGAPIVLGSHLPTPPANIGPSSTPNYESLAEQAVHDLGNGSTVFAGQRDDPFFGDLGAIFDLLDIRVPPGNMGGGVDNLSGFNVHTIALKVPAEKLRRENDPVIGVWASARRQVANAAADLEAQGFKQVSRLGMPLVNEVIIALKDKDGFNTSQPRGDYRFADYLRSPDLARRLNSLYRGTLEIIDETGREDLLEIFQKGLPNLNRPIQGVPSDMLRLNTMAFSKSSRSRLGLLEGDLNGFPNGRRLMDDVVDIALRAVAQGYGPLLQSAFRLPNKTPNNLLGDGVDENDVPFLDHFPYVGTPHAGFDHKHRHKPWGVSGFESSAVPNLRVFKRLANHAEK